MATRASGTFEVKLIPQSTTDQVPDSGTDQLANLVGTMAITIADGGHSYDFEYTLAE